MQDQNLDGQIDEGDAATTRGHPAAGSQPNDSTMYRSGSVGETSEGTIATERSGVHRAGSAEAQPFTTDRPLQRGPSGTEHSPVAGTTPPGYADTGYRDATPDHRADDEVTVVAGPRPRASLLATLSLIFGVAGALFVLTGTLAGYGIALGALALLLSFAGLSATSRRHVAGKSDALLGLLLGLGAVAVGILAVTGQFGWPNTDADTVQRFRDWLDAQTVDRF
jgi:hypothetical protein